MILVDTNVVIRSYEAAEALLSSKSPLGRADPSTDSLGQIDDAWKKLFAAGEVGTITEVLGEITKAKTRPALRWTLIVKDHYDHCIAKPFNDYYENLREIDEFVRESWQPQDADAFLGGADAHLVAMAAAKGWAVATLETPSVPQLDRGAAKFSGAIKLPFIAWRFGVPIKTIYDLFRAPGRR